MVKTTHHALLIKVPLTTSPCFFNKKNVLDIFLVRAQALLEYFKHFGRDGKANLFTYPLLLLPRKASTRDPMGRG